MTRSPSLRLRIAIRGAVQGVGFRPFIYRLAREYNLSGWVNNSSQGVFLEVEGDEDRVRTFLLRVEPEKPPLSFIQSLEPSFLDPVGYSGFEIRPSTGGEKVALVLPDVATCQQCLDEIRDLENRRYRYPFTNCTHCGPRYSIIESLPYDRARTSMRRFSMCAKCRDEYEDPADRRFHAQPNACPVCGPSLELWAPDGRVEAERYDAILSAADAVERGHIVALKGIGGFHLIADARNASVVERLRRRKHRDQKPLALMAPSVDEIRCWCNVGSFEERLLLSPEAPIVILHRLEDSDHAVARNRALAPRNPTLGVMLPYSPLHHLLLDELALPVVATSGNVSDEPICFEEEEALNRLHGIADLFLVHNRPIVRHVDDSVVTTVRGRELVLRRARGYAPLPIDVAQSEEPQAAASILATGAHLKNSVALSVDDSVFVSQHIGDLETLPAFDAFQGVVASLTGLYESEPQLVAHDLHPDYLSTVFARESGARTIGVQHHIAHVLACMAENRVSPPALGVSWDGTGYGTDGLAWGGEFFELTNTEVRRVGHFRSFPLPGGDAAARDGRRCALGMLFETEGDKLFKDSDSYLLSSFSREERSMLRQMLERSTNSPLTTSVGRIFDAVAALSGVRAKSAFEAQAAMEFEFAATGADVLPYPIDIRTPETEGDSLVVDWEPALEALMADLAQGATPGSLSDRFHQTLAGIVVEVARHCQHRRVLLSGGCFQNRLLTTKTIDALRAADFIPYWHQRIPPNDGGISLGQIVAAKRSLRTIPASRP